MIRIENAGLSVADAYQGMDTNDVVIKRMITQV